MKNTIKLEVCGEIGEYPYEISLSELAKLHADKVEGTILLGVVSGTLKELTATVTKPRTIEFLTMKDKAGFQTYRRSLLLLFLESYQNVMGKDEVQNLSVLFTVGDGLFIRKNDKTSFSKDILIKVKKRMEELVRRDAIISKRSVPAKEALLLVPEEKRTEREKLFKYRRISSANFYRINEFEDYFFGYMVPQTGYLKYFDLVEYHDGMLLRMPTRKNPEALSDFTPRDKLFTVQENSCDWGKKIGISSVSDLNDMILKGEALNMVLLQEALMEKRIAELAETISNDPKKRIVLIAGPSSSGKTTFSHRLSIQLRAQGLNTYPIAVDDYFLERTKTPLDEDGNPDFESINSVDVETLNADMKALLRGEEVKMPTFDFIEGKRHYKGNTLKIGEKDILIMEGIHCLNDKLTYDLPKEEKFKIYISSLTHINIDGYNRIPTTDVRLIRRIVRDERTRGLSAKETIRRWDSVRKGEENNIFPYQEEADAIFNSALMYELCVLKTYAEPLLFGIEADSKEHIEANRLLKLFDFFLGLDVTLVPGNSLLREFVGGGLFKV